MIKKEDCRDCVWYDTDTKRCAVEKISLYPNEDGKIKPPDICHYSVDWRRRKYA